MSCDAAPTLLACVRFSLCECVWFVVLKFSKALQTAACSRSFGESAMLCSQDWVRCGLYVATRLCLCVFTMCDPSMLHAHCPTMTEPFPYTLTYTSKNKSSEQAMCPCTGQFTHAPFGRLDYGFSYTLALFNNPSWLLHATNTVQGAQQQTLCEWSGTTNGIVGMATVLCTLYCTCDDMGRSVLRRKFARIWISVWIGRWLSLRFGRFRHGSADFDKF